ncbi:ATP-binding protein [Campylobacter troglodytis]|uniref:ATP-binding protein n=1 Tax=Campylobacter troglodytis TaxID=654363 RepID=UPI00115B143F|nr:ATP-binding protein [Campylobacter troglodytis]TQR60782.1 ATP-binding protein [Campylobacter troglodytis]
MSFEKHYAAVYRAKRGGLKYLSELDEVRLKDLVGIEEQKEALMLNTERFLNGKSFHHALLWGARGTGKSSLIKAVFNELKEQNLRIVQLDKSDLSALPEIIDELRELAFKFIIFCDDFSFEEGDLSYKFLKPLLEGGIERPPSNIVLYLSSNRRHLLAEFQRDNEGVSVDEGELHLGDLKEEKLSLSDRFGLWLGFYQESLEDYLKIVDFYFKDSEIFKKDKEALHTRAKHFALLRASRSGRVAKQFYLSFKDGLKF